MWKVSRAFLERSPRFFLLGSALQNTITPLPQHHVEVDIIRREIDRIDWILNCEFWIG